MWVQDKTIIVSELGHAELRDGGVGDLPEVGDAERYVVCVKGLVGQGVSLSDATNILKEINS